MVKKIIKRIIRKTGRRYFPYPVLFPNFGEDINDDYKYHNDYVRYAVAGLALSRIKRENISGALAEIGVFKGELSAFINRVSPDSKFYLFDSFEGFSKTGFSEDKRFRNTSEDIVLKNIGTKNNIILRKGFVPESFAGLEDERFAFVFIDVDKYEPIYDSLVFFYPRMNTGGYILVHDYNSPESDYGSKRAVDEFMKDKEEFIIDVPDARGTVMFRKY